MSKDKRLTSVKVEEDLFIQFKEECVRTNFSFQKLANRCIYLYLNDEEFKVKVHKLLLSK
jgi:hypothetical protein